MVDRAAWGQEGTMLDCDILAVVPCGRDWEGLSYAKVSIYLTSCAPLGWLTRSSARLATFRGCLAGRLAVVLNTSSPMQHLSPHQPL